MYHLADFYQLYGIFFFFFCMCALNQERDTFSLLQNQNILFKINWLEQPVEEGDVPINNVRLDSDIQGYF